PASVSGVRAIFLGLLAACGTRATPIAIVDRPPPPAASTTSPVAPSRATYHPLPTGWKALDALEPSDTVPPFVGASGQRWLVTTTPAPTDADPDATRLSLAGASSIAPEDLVAVRRRPNGFMFVGESGATYFAPAALDDITTRRTPAEPLRAAAAGKQAIIAITVKDTLVRSLDDGASWTPV